MKTKLLIIALILACLGLGYAWYGSSQKYNQELAMHVKLEKALADTVRTHQNERGEWVSEKLTLQGDVTKLTELNGALSEEQKELIKRVKKVNKEKDVFAAALFTANATIDSLLNTEVIIINDSTLAFMDSTEHFNYDISIGNVQPFKDYKPYLSINRFSVPTDYFITFNWDKNKREQYPVSFAVTPTNPYIRVTSVESYAIPEVNRTELKPNLFKRLNNLPYIKPIIFITGLGLGVFLAK